MRYADRVKELGAADPAAGGNENGQRLDEEGNRHFKVKKCFKIEHNYLLTPPAAFPTVSTSSCCPLFGGIFSDPLAN